MNIEKYIPATIEFLQHLIRIPSLSGQEQEAMAYIYNEFKALVDEIELIPLKDTITDDPDYSTPIAGIKYEGRHNIRAVVKGRDRGRSVLFNTHADVVPPAALQERAFDPYLQDNAIFGRGACDAKGQIATMFLLLNYLKDEHVKRSGDLVFHIVVEEENGGNGTLAAIRRSEQADAAIVMEPTGLKILPAVRGAVWFRVTCIGTPGHSGSAGKRVSALDLALEVRHILQAYHDQLLIASKGIPLFDDFEDPMPITFGKLHAGDWPATIPNKAVLEGVLGFLSNKTRFEIMDDIRHEIFHKGSAHLKNSVEIDFMYRHDAHVLNPNHPLVRDLSRACVDSEISPVISAMPASCDSWFYNNQLNIPTIVFGPGELAVAHSNREHIKIDQLVSAARILIHFVQK